MTLSYRPQERRKQHDSSSPPAVHIVNGHKDDYDEIDVDKDGIENVIIDCIRTPEQILSYLNVKEYPQLIGTFVKCPWCGAIGHCTLILDPNYEITAFCCSCRKVGDVFEFIAAMLKLDPEKDRRVLLCVAAHIAGIPVKAGEWVTAGEAVLVGE